MNIININTPIDTENKLVVTSRERGGEEGQNRGRRLRDTNCEV